MKAANRYLADMLDLELPEAASDVLWRVCKPTAARSQQGAVILTLPFEAQKTSSTKFIVDPDRPRRQHELVVRAYGDSIVRLTLALAGDVPGDESVMFEWDEALKPQPLEVRSTAGGWEIVDGRGTVRMRVTTQDAPTKPWPGQPDMPAPAESLDAVVLPDGRTAVPLMAYDSFFPASQDSLPLAFIERGGVPHRLTYSLHARPNEHFAGTGERFAAMDLAGRTLLLENADGLGVNNRRCYKNIPFYLSSRPYGLLIHTPHHVRLSLADISTRAAQGLVEDNLLDLFFIGGGSLERIVYHYRQITGFPANVPLWSFGTWMSRMSYHSAEEVRQVGRRLREGQFPCDVLHLDVGWFEEDWVCDWEFSPSRFPQPEAFLREMRQSGYRVTLWQLPHVAKTSKLFAEALEKKYVVYSEKTGKISDSVFSGLEHVATIDVTNPQAVQWYQGLIERLLRMGVAAFKTDFGEHIHMDVDYAAMPGRKLHNLFGVLYQRAVFEASGRVSAEPVTWSRTAWVGCQRYPVHWGGDCASTWDGLAGSLRGGLHLGLSGFAFWSCDVPGFHALPNFHNHWPSDNLYVRWTQAAVFNSHLRYHGAQPREPYEYPAVADVVRQWLRLRYALIPYLVEQSNKAIRGGLPILRAMIFHHQDDPLCWHIDDQYYFGDSLLVAPVLNDEGVRDVYLPAGKWVDLWTGQRHQGPVLLRDVHSPLDRIPVYAVEGATIPIYPERVLSTDEMDLANTAALAIDGSFRGLPASALGRLCGW